MYKNLKWENMKEETRGWKTSFKKKSLDQLSFSLILMDIRKKNWMFKEKFRWLAEIMNRKGRKLKSLIKESVTISSVFLKTIPC